MTVVEVGRTATDVGMTATDAGMTTTASGMTAVIGRTSCHCHPWLSLPPLAVIAGSTRNPVVARQWIPDQVRDDN